MTRKEIRIAGFGGQGIIRAGYIVGKAAAVYDEKEAVQTQSYGPEARGGACSADVVIDDEVIDYPLISKADVLIVMSEDAYNTYRSSLASNGKLIVDDGLVHLTAEDEKRGALKVPATKMAAELGKRIVANIVMLGFFSSATGMVTRESMKKAILSSIPKGTEELNLKAFERGFEFGLKARG